MFAHKTSDLHIHLNGSFSLEFLKKIAERNDALVEYQKLLTVREEYKKLLAEEESQGFHDKSIALIWAQFSLIHKIMKTLVDIEEGTINVIAVSQAKYLEIRTTPKETAGANWEKYVDAFVYGLVTGNIRFQGRKLARGLLSLDRTIHDAEIAYQIIDRVVSDKKRHGLLVGIDISGNPAQERKLTGETLATVLVYALKQDIGVAIHIGEVDTDIEKNDVNIILAALTAWQAEHPANSFAKKVRLGHGIFLTEKQRARIKELQIPMEVCPSCHEKLNWWNKSKPHPVTQIYQFWKDPVVSGTDDEMIFLGNAQEENHTVLQMLGYPQDKEPDEACEHQAKFRFV